MHLGIVGRSALFIAVIWSCIYGFSNHFEESSTIVEMPLNEQRDFCINNSVSSLDLWNNRYLHLESSDGYYEINPKNTIILRFLRNRKVSAKREGDNNVSLFSIDTRLYFSRCFTIHNLSSDSIKVSVSTYRRFCFSNALVILVILTLFLIDPKIVINEVIFFGLSAVAFFISAASTITYVPQLISLPGMKVIGVGLGYSLGFISFYTVFLVSIFSFIFRVIINYYHFSNWYLHIIINHLLGCEKWKYTIPFSIVLGICIWGYKQLSPQLFKEEKKQN